MAVIDTSMDMPRCCDICPNYQGENAYCLKGCFIPYKMFDVGDARHKDCPLISIDGLADAIEQFPFTYGFASDIEREIYKYCNKENKDANR